MASTSSSSDPDPFHIDQISEHFDSSGRSYFSAVVRTDTLVIGVDDSWGSWLAYEWRPAGEPLVTEPGDRQQSRKELAPRVVAELRRRCQQLRGDDSQDAVPLARRRGPG